jgi:hypothetical protein
MPFSHPSSCVSSFRTLVFGSEAGTREHCNLASSPLSSKTQRCQSKTQFDGASLCNRSPTFRNNVGVHQLPAPINYNLLQQLGISYSENDCFIESIHFATHCQGCPHDSPQPMYKDIIGLLFSLIYSNTCFWQSDAPKYLHNAWLTTALPNKVVGWHHNYN